MSNYRFPKLLVYVSKLSSPSSLFKSAYTSSGIDAWETSSILPTNSHISKLSQTHPVYRIDRWLPPIAHRTWVSLAIGVVNHHEFAGFSGRGFTGTCSLISDL